MAEQAEPWTYEQRRPVDTNAGGLGFTAWIFTASGVGTYAALAAGSAPEPWHTIAVALAVGCAMSIPAATWRLLESDRRAFEVTRKREAPGGLEFEQINEQVRPVIQAATGTIRRGRFSLDREMWQRFFSVAQANGGRVTRDAIVAARALPREHYHNWNETRGELQRLGIIDERNAITDTGRAFYAQEVALPYLRVVPRGVPSTNANGRTEHERSER